MIKQVIKKIDVAVVIDSLPLLWSSHYPCHHEWQETNKKRKGIINYKSNNNNKTYTLPC